MQNPFSPTCEGIQHALLQMQYCSLSMISLVWYEWDLCQIQNQILHFFLRLTFSKLIAYVYFEGDDKVK